MTVNLSTEDEPISINQMRNYRNRFSELKNRVPDNEVCNYLETAVHCYEARIYNASVIFIWSSISCYYRLFVRDSYDVFRRFYKWEKGEEFDPDRHIKDNLLIDLCGKMGFLPGALERIKDIQNTRNTCAHPNRIPFNPEKPIKPIEDVLPSKVFELFELAVSEVLSCAVIDRPLTEFGASLVHKYVIDEGVNDENLIRDLINKLQQDELPMLSDRLLNTYSDEVDKLPDLETRLAQQENYSSNDDDTSITTEEIEEDEVSERDIDQSRMLDLSNLADDSWEWEEDITTEQEWTTDQSCSDQDRVETSLDVLSDQALDNIIQAWRIVWDKLDNQTKKDRLCHLRSKIKASNRPLDLSSFVIFPPSVPMEGSVLDAWRDICSGLVDGLNSLIGSGYEDQYQDLYENVQNYCPSDITAMLHITSNLTEGDEDYE